MRRLEAYKGIFNFMNKNKTSLWCLIMINILFQEERHWFYWIWQPLRFLKIIKNMTIIYNLNASQILILLAQRNRFITYWSIIYSFFLLETNLIFFHIEKRLRWESSFEWFEYGLKWLILLAFLNDKWGYNWMNFGWKIK